MKQLVWIVGKTLSIPENAWEFQGVFETEESASAQCRTSRYFIGPAVLNQALPDTSHDWVGAYYPNAN